MFSYKELVAGGLSGIIEVSSTHWIDNIKTQIQDSKLKNKKFNFKNISFNNLYWGYYPRLIGIIPMRTVFWSSQYISNSYLQNKNLNNNYKYLFAGLFSGSIQTVIDNPIEVMKVKLITNTDIKTNNINYISGFTPTLLRNSLFCGVFNLYVQNNKEQNKLVSGAIGGILASIISHPFDVIKTEIQKVNSTNKNTFKFIIDNIKKPYIFTYGIIPRTILSFSTMSIGYFTFNLLFNLFN